MGPDLEMQLRLFSIGRREFEVSFGVRRWRRKRDAAFAAEALEVS
jgi:hypothetical protein